ncbi:MAG: thiamine diphosphokinase [Clostridiales bacterium]|jgi:thiamine pyrophosphokinase|nr:thiamine diphosphokinase [Clostridiales bacterium]
MRTAVIVLNGEYIPKRLSDGYIICADGGYKLLSRIGVVPDVILGDGDSIGEFSESIPSGVLRVHYPCDKDMTDGELCVRYAAKNGFSEIVLYGALGGRQDHVEANLALMALAARLDMRAVAYDEDVEIHYIDRRFDTLEKKVKKNIFVSIVPFTSAAHIIETKGLKYPLNNVRVSKLSSLGISNVSVDENIRIKIDKGSALIFLNIK